MKCVSSVTSNSPWPLTIKRVRCRPLRFECVGNSLSPTTFRCTTKSIRKTFTELCWTMMVSRSFPSLSDVITIISARLLKHSTCASKVNDPMVGESRSLLLAEEREQTSESVNDSPQVDHAEYRRRRDGLVDWGEDLLGHWPNERCVGHRSRLFHLTLDPRWP